MNIAGPGSSITAPSQSVPRTVAAASCIATVVLPIAPLPESSVTFAIGIRSRTNQRRDGTVLPCQSDTLTKGNGSIGLMRTSGSRH
jgi:hypothetical protein